MTLINSQILKAPQNWIFVAIVMVFVSIVSYFFLNQLNPNTEE